MYKICQVNLGQKTLLKENKKNFHLKKAHVVECQEGEFSLKL